MMAIRISKILFVFSAALFAGLVGIDNILDYQINFTSVQHVLMMDSVYPHNNSMWRAVESVWLHHLAYWLIILTELVVAVLAQVYQDSLAFSRILLFSAGSTTVTD